MAANNMGTGRNMGLGRIVGHDMVPKRRQRGGLGGMTPQPTPAAGNTGIVPPAVPATPAAKPMVKPAVQPQRTPEQMAEQSRVANERVQMSLAAGGGGVRTDGPAPEWQQQRNASLGGRPVQAPVMQPQGITPEQQAMMSIAPTAATIAEANALRNGDYRVGQTPAPAAPQAAPPTQTVTANPQQRMDTLKAEIQQLQASQGGVLTPQQEAYYQPLWLAAFDAAKGAA